MKRKLLQAVVSLLLMLCLFSSCKKEFSCENCIDGTKVNLRPIASAGPDTTILLPTDSVLLNGSSSNDPDGSILTWKWTKISGPALFTMIHFDSAITMVRSMAQGIYLFELKVTDNEGASANDTVQVTINSPGSDNHPPVACSGADETISLPVTTTTLDGRCSTDPDSNISSFLWTKISGPNSYNIVNRAMAQTQVVNLVEGIYLFELKVTDAGGLFDMDTVMVKVSADSQPINCTTCKIAFVSDRDGNPEIYSCTADGSHVMRLTNDAGMDDQPRWSPSGSQIVFVSTRSGSSEIYTMNADGSNVVRKTFTGNCQEPAWSPDGSKITYSTLSDGSQNIWMINVTGGSPSLLLAKPGVEGQSFWSPDGTTIAVSSDWFAYDFVYDIFLINSDGTNFRALTGNISDHLDYLFPAWSPKGNEIAVTILQRTGIDEYNARIGIMNPDGSNLIAIKDSVAPFTDICWSDDGSRILYTSLTGSRKDISWVSLDGLSSAVIVTNGWNADWKHL